MDRKGLAREVDAAIDMFRLGAITGTDTTITGPASGRLIEVLTELKKLVCGRVVVTGNKITYYDDNGRPWLTGEATTPTSEDG